MAQIDGGSDNDTLNGTYDNDTIFGREGNDLLRGFLGDDLILGHEGDDLVVGGPRADSLFGHYLVNDSEFPDLGFDTLSYRDSFFAVRIDLQAGTASGGDAEGDRFGGFEGVEGSQDGDTLQGDAKVNRLVGWDGDDILMGRAGADSLLGGNGNDTLAGGAGADLHDGGAGTDTIWYLDATAAVTADLLVPAVNTGDAAGDSFKSIEGLIGSASGDSLRGDNLANTIGGGFFDTGNDLLYGRGGNDTLLGAGGNDRLDGGTGADRLEGGPGNDIFVVDNAGDRVLEAASQGSDTVYASVSYRLAAGRHVETLATTSVAGTPAVRLAGNELAQRIIGNNGSNGLYGNGGNDTLHGYGGNDLLAGGAGNDTLVGGAGFDSFLVNTALNATTNVDRIVNFSVPQDTIRLDNAVMPGLGAALGTLAAAKFWKSTAGVAHDTNDRIIYDIDTGRLFYDGNGNAAGGAVHFTTLAPNLALTNADFVVI